MPLLETTTLKIRAFRLDAYRRPAARILTAAAFGLFCLSAYFFRPSPRPDLLEEAFSLMLAGGLTFWIALWLNRSHSHLDASRRRNPAPVQAVAVRSPERISITRRLSVLLGLAAFLLLIEMNANLLGIPELQYVQSTIQFILFAAGLILITLGFAGLRFRVPTISISLRSPAFPLLAITLLAFILRAVALGSAVHHFVDEIHFSNAIMSIRPPESTVKLLWPINSITAFPWLFSYMQNWGVALLGRNLEGLRAISVVLGTLGVPALYFLARELFDRRAALLAALLLAVFPPHIQFSRIGLNNIADPLFGTLALAFLIRGLKHGRRADFALGGAALGLTQYFYEGGRFLFPALILLSLSWFILAKPRFHPEPDEASDSSGEPASRARTEQRVLVPRAASLVTFFITAILIALPLYATLLATRQPFNPRFQTVGVGGSYWLRVAEFGTPQTLEQHLLVPFLVYVHQPETALYYGGEQAMLLSYVVPFAFVGLFGLLAYWRSPGVVVVLWLLLVSAGNMLLTEAAIYARYVVAFPALALLSALGIRMLVGLLWPGKSPWRGRLVALLVLVLVVGQVTYFFGPHLSRYNDQLRPTFDSEDAIFRSAGFPWGTQIHVFASTTPGQIYLSSIANYLADGLSVFVLPPEDVTPAYLSALSRSIDQAFFVEPFDTVTVDLLKQHFTLEGPFHSPYNIPSYRQLMLYYAEATTPAG